MNEPTATASADAMQRSPSFTLATALALLGHDCRGACPKAATECRSVVWFMRLPTLTTSAWTRTVVEVSFLDVVWTATRSRALISEVNACIRPDRLRVRVRSVAERTAFNQALAGRRMSTPSPAGRRG